MKKYIVYRLLGDKNEPDRKAELVAVEYGGDIIEVTPTLIKSVTRELAALPEYSGCKTVAYEPIETFDNQIYRYYMLGVVYPPKAAENILINFEIEEISVQPKDNLIF